VLSNGRISVGTAATAIDGVYNQYAHIILHNDDNTDAVYIGGPGVTTANGLVLQKEQTFEIGLGPLEQLYAVSSKTGHSVSFLRHTI
jgi:hypothetical protein